MPKSPLARSFGRRAATAGLAAVLATAGLLPTMALADPQADLAQASATISSLSSEASSLEQSLQSQTAELEQTRYQIGQKQSQIEETQQQLQTAKGELGTTVRSSYKNGSVSLLQIALGSNSISDFVQNVYYAGKVSSAQAQSIARVNDLQGQLKGEEEELESRQQGQQAAVDSLNSQVAEYNSKLEQARSYYNSLSAEVQEQLAAQAAAEQQQAQESGGQASAVSQVISEAHDGGTSSEATQAAETPAQAEQQDDAPSQGQAQSPSQDETPQQQPQTRQATQEEPSTSKSGGASGGGLSTAYSMIGVPYEWGGTSASGVDCSGLVCYSYGYARGRTTYDMIDSLKSTGDWKTSMDELQVGDLVFPSDGHVGIYIGGGQMIHAPYPGRTVCIASVYSFIGGGSY
nr:NlpC/P60 family protein [uncultured Olsenella sp.]